MKGSTVSARYGSPVNQRGQSVSVRCPRAEEIFAGKVGCPLTAAHSRIMRCKQEAEAAVDAFLEAETPERAIWFAGALIERIEVGSKPACFTSAVREQQERDSAEDSRETELLTSMTLDAWKSYKRAAHPAIAATLAFLAAGDRHFGLSA